MPIPADIITRIERDFAKSDAASVVELMSELSGEGNATFTDRVLRCLVYMSKGSVPDLTHAVELARTDWRDIIYFAEYDENDVHARDLSKPFQ